MIDVFSNCHEPVLELRLVRIPGAELWQTCNSIVLRRLTAILWTMRLCDLAAPLSSATVGIARLTAVSSYLPYQHEAAETL